MIKERILKADEKTFGKVERGLINRQTVLKELNPTKISESDLKVIKELYGQVPLVEVDDDGETIGVVKWNNNIDTLYSGELIVESDGITQLNDGRFVYMSYTAGWFDAKVIHKEKAYKILSKAKLLDKFLKY